MATTISDKLGLLGVANELQHSIHEGKAYGLSAQGTIAASSSFTVMSKIIDREIHFHILEGDFSKGGIRITLYEAPTTTSDGTEITNIRNLNRNYSDVTSMPIFQTPTVTDVGTIISQVFKPLTGSGVNVESAKLGLAGGRILKKGTKHLFVIENTDNAAVNFGINFIWSEHLEGTI